MTVASELVDSDPNESRAYMEITQNTQLFLGPLIVASEGNFPMAKTEEQQMDFSILSATQQGYVCNAV